MANSSSFTINIKALFDAGQVKSGLNDIQISLKNLKLPDNLTANLNKSFDNANKALDDFISKTEKGVKTKADASGITKSFEAVRRELTNLDNLMLKVKSQLGEGADLSKIIKLDDKTLSGIQKLENEIKNLQSDLTALGQDTDKIKALETALGNLKKGSASFKAGESILEAFKEGDFDKALNILNQITTKLKAVQTGLQAQGKSTAGVEATVKAFDSMRTVIVNTQKEASTIYDQIGEKSAEAAQKTSDAYSQATGKINNSATALNNYRNSAVNAEKAVVDLTTRQAQFVREVDQVKSRIQYFFGLSNAINLVKRAVRSAVDTIKDLDKAMTETAVVTDFTVSDMWKQLPEYTKRANELGVTTQQAYESATLFYQQGLNTQQAAALSTETLKMARIAGLDAAEATDRMTNALRGFNMELDAQSAQRIDDVYSELAARSASNVDEISTAMTKVASLAHSANMEFETTAAFLAQIIETTRESAETAGTALKTVVARFSEVKKLYGEDQLKGTDEEGQVIDVNKIGTALRTAGIDLNKYFLGEVGLDDIFMELASKWDSLTSVQQRYIATQAAGSRQQSRFIALMQDYARTQELVGMAYEANGASAKQFEKTQESLQSKLARLKNAWDEFLMGLTNNVMVKTFVDTLTNLLNFLNKITNGFDNTTNSILKFGVALAGLAGGRALFRSEGILDNAIGALTQNTIIGTLLGKAGIGGKYSKINATEVQGPPTAQGAQPKTGTTIIGNIGQLGKGLWGGASKLGSKIATSDLGFLLGMSDIGGASTLGPIATGLTGIATALGAIAVAVGVVVAGYQAWLRLTPEGHLKQAKEYAKTMQTVASNTQSAARSAKEAESKYGELTNKIDSSTSVLDRGKAIQDRNEYISELIKQNPSLAQNVKTTTEGQQLKLEIDESVLSKAAEKAQEGVLKANADANLANALQAGAQANVYDARIARIRSDAAYEERELTQAEQISIKQYEVAASQSNTEMRQYAKMAYQQQLQGKNLTDDIVNLTSDFLADSFDSDAYLKEINKQRSENWWGGQATKAQLQADYYKLYGVQADTSMGRKELAQAVATRQVDQNKEVSTQQLTELLSGTSSDIYKSMLEAYSGTGKAAEINLSNVVLDAPNLDIAKILGLDATESNFETLGTIIGMDANKLKEHMIAQAKVNKTIQQQTKSKLFETALNSGINVGTNQQLFEQIQSLTPQTASLISDIASQAAEALSQEDMSKLFPQLLDMNNEQLSQFSNFFKNFNLDNPINAFAQLKSAQQDALKLPDNDPFKVMLGNIETANAALFDTGNLVQNFITSESYDTLSQSIEDFIEKNGKVTVDNIEDLAEECSDLKKILDNTSVSAQGLADAFTLLEKGSVPIDSITSSLLAALSAGESFETLMGKVQEWIDGFDEGPDMAQGTEHIIDVLDEAEKYVQDWQFGNKPLQNIYDHIFGDGAYKKYMDQAYERGLGFDEIETKLQNDIDRIKKLAENEGEGALDLLAKQGKVTKDKNGKYEWDLSQYKDAADPVQAAISDIASSLGVADDAARAFIEAWGSHMYDLGAEWDNLQFGQKMKAFATDLGDSSIVTQQELDALAAATGKDAQEVEDAINKARQAADKPIIVKVNWQKENGENLSGDDLIKQFDQTANISSGWVTSKGKKEWRKDYSSVTAGFDAKITKDIGGGVEAVVNGIDFDGLHNKLVEAFKLTPQQANEVIDNIAKESDKPLIKDIQVPKINPESGAIEMVTDTIQADSAEALEAGIRAAQEAADTSLIAQKLADTDFTNMASALQSAIKQGGEAGGEAAASSIQSSVQGKPYTISVGWQWADGVGPHAASGGIVYVNHSKGGIAGSYAKGSENFHVGPGMALTGEEGPELIWNKEGGYSYLTGKNGPEFQNLQPGDRIFNAEETRKILASSSHHMMDSYASGGWKPSGDNNKGGGSGSGSSDKDEDNEWKNEIDWLYNVVQNIEELERQQNILQEEYNDLLTDQTKTGQDLYKMLIQQLGNLYAQLDHQTYTLEKREQEMREFMDTTNDMDDYLWYNWNDRTIEIDWDKIDQITDEEQYNHVKELIDQAEDIQDKMDDAEDAIIDVNNAIQDLENIWRDTFVDFEDRVLKAVIKMYQTVIDNYSELNDTLNDSNSAILDAINKEISLQRQIRDNTKTEEEIANDEAQLAYLRRDTSGGNDLAALQLERELNDQRQNYEDNLVDQAVQRLQDDNDAAAAQREKQIEIMQAQLDYQSENGEFNEYIRELLTSAMGGDGELLTDSELASLLKTQENWDAMSAVSKEVWEEELNGTFKEVAAFLLKEQGEAEGTYFTAVTAAFQGVQDQFDKFYHGSYSQGSIHNGGGGSSTSTKSKNIVDPSKDPPKDPPKNPPSVNIFTVDQKNNSMTVSTGGNLTRQEAKTLTDRLNKQRILKYATGGLNTETGLAWLDGTAKAPEYVLNAKQTDAFLRLADVLPAAMSNTSSSVSNTFGTTTNNIVINVDKIDSDYSVDQMVDRVKEKLFETGSYRNNNVLNFLR